MVAFRGLTRAVFCSSTSAWIKKKIRVNLNKMLQKERKTQAVSDGELNMSSFLGTGSSPSLSSGSAGGELRQGEDGPASRVVSWAVCFERLMEDPVGVRYFTAFLKSEVSDENILFWQACEKFQKTPATSLEELKAQARSIYDLYLSESSFNAVNIDDTARVNKSDLEKPNPEMFSKAQQQIYKLMKFDSYARFVRSPLYQNCMLASVEGRPLPDIEPQNKSVTPTSGRKITSGKTPSSDSKSNKRKTPEKRGSWGDVSYRQVTVSRQESQISVKSSSSVELGSLSNRSEDGSSSPLGSEPNAPARADKYCCVFLPDGTASLAPARAGLTLRGMLSSLCEKRGFPMKDIVIYLQGKDKNVCQRQQPLSLDQDSSILQDQQVTLELRVTFTLDIVLTGKTIGIMAKSSKTLGDAVSSVLQKHELRPQDAVITMSGSREPLNMDTTVLRLANKTLCLDRVKNGGNEKGNLAVDRSRTGSKPKNEMDGLVEMLTRVQCSRADDQRGLLTKEQLELPSFLQVPAGQRKGEEGKNTQQKPEALQKSCSREHTKAAEKTADEEKPLVNGNHKDSNREKKTEQCVCASSAKGMAL
ncbi:regulator of G-protein signaling 14a isoform X2 [Tachysurus fulvidraco]|uniref:regulator of G-protein signaling 14a isoform X2 n=1 Tax=Tachysurus fulvidraco TaxID=1234273 RepID=UPI000F515D83|nr:regulator of G-protein signaling 14a isoform X2 [Tachysurus fulvidraco]